jgi:hypothetical protein
MCSHRYKNKFSVSCFFARDCFRGVACFRKCIIKYFSHDTLGSQTSQLEMLGRLGASLSADQQAAATVGLGAMIKHVQARGEKAKKDLDQRRLNKVLQAGYPFIQLG